MSQTKTTRMEACRAVSLCSDMALRAECHAQSPISLMSPAQLSFQPLSGVLCCCGCCCSGYFHSKYFWCLRSAFTFFAHLNEGWASFITYPHITDASCVAENTFEFRKIIMHSGQSQVWHKGAWTILLSAGLELLWIALVSTFHCILNMLIPLLKSSMIYWICFLKDFREKSILFYSNDTAPYFGTQAAWKRRFYFQAPAIRQGYTNNAWKGLE